MKNSRSIVDQPNWYPPWAPRVWSGMDVPNYWRLLADNKFRIHPTRYPMTAMVGCTSVINSMMGSLQWLLKRSAIEKTEIEQPPIFIIGHWRSGTTLLHELMSLDDALTFPNTYDAFVPGHLLVSGFLKHFVRLIMPARRPFDDMSFDVNYPQEDDFALLAMGAPSYYRRLAFPDNQDQFIRELDSASLNPIERKKLAESILYFYKALTLRSGKRLVLKSPPHTARIELLCELFPGAKFVHISRHPQKLVPSTLRMWAISDDVHGFQLAKHTDESLMGHVVKTKTVLYEAYRRDRSMLADNQLVEVSFEQLTSNPADTIDHVYQKLELDGASQAVVSTLEYFEQNQHHQKNKFDSESIRDQIDDDWSDYMQMFGYEVPCG